MSAMVSQITILKIVYSSDYSGADQRKHPVTGEFPAQRASNAENVSIWGRHHVVRYRVVELYVTAQIENEFVTKRDNIQ